MRCPVEETVTSRRPNESDALGSIQLPASIKPDRENHPQINCLDPIVEAHDNLKTVIPHRPLEFGNSSEKWHLSGHNSNHSGYSPDRCRVQVQLWLGLKEKWSRPTHVSSLAKNSRAVGSAYQVGQILATGHLANLARSSVCWAVSPQYKAAKNPTKPSGSNYASTGIEPAVIHRLEKGAAGTTLVLVLHKCRFCWDR